MRYKRYSGALDEQEAFEYHVKYYGGIHTFYIRNIAEYVRMRPFINMFRPKIKVILARELRGVTLRIPMTQEQKDMRKDYMKERRKKEARQKNYYGKSY